MAVDFGTVRIGLAISDEMRMLASARGVIPSDPFAPNTIALMAVAENAQRVLLGLPKTLANKDSAMTKQVMVFGEKLRIKLEKHNIALEFRDERLTSVMANFNISQSGMAKHKREEKSLRDEEAARILLQEYLDANP
ncbi:MAG: Holliday junction resolvase RuvX [Candidatus Kapaibacterium sp.]|jgi:putative Holliday junction resolvase